MAPQHDPKFYFEPPRILTFQVENTLFRLPVRPLISVSLVFKDMLGLPNVNQEGLSDENPIVIVDESAETFRAVIEWVFSKPSAHTILDFNRSQDFRPEFRPKSKDESLRLFRFSRKFQMEELETLCSVDLRDRREWAGMERITFSRDYDLGLKWAAQGLKDLAAAPDPLSIAQTKEMDLELFGLVIYIQQKARITSVCSCFCQRSHSLYYDEPEGRRGACSCVFKCSSEDVSGWIQEAQSEHWISSSPL